MSIPPHPARLLSVRIEGLFGRFDHQLEFKPESQILIITAPNGYGKTVSLQLINAVFRRRFRQISRTDFHQMTVRFDNDVQIIISRHRDVRLFDEPATNSDPRELFVHLIKQNVITDTWNYTAEVAGPHSSRLNMIERLIPHLDRISTNTWIDMSDDQTLDLQEVLERYADRLPDEFQTARIPTWLREVTSWVDCRLIETQRLMAVELIEYMHRRPHPDETISFVVTKHAKELSSRIKATLATYASVSQGLDQNFPHRVISRVTSEHEPLGETELRRAISNLETKRNYLTKAGLLTQSQYNLPPLPQNEIVADLRHVLQVYLEDTEKKLEIFDEIFDRISLFKSIINDKFRFKSVDVNQDQGISVLHNGTPIHTKNKEVPLTALSSGEQHELVMTYELVFLTNPNTLYLIDEPEISLHVAWQKRFLPDLLEIISLNGFRAIVATHSPQIIGDMWEFSVDLARN